MKNQIWAVILICLLVACAPRTNSLVSNNPLICQVLTEISFAHIVKPP
jgi:hypothetical protein